MRYNIGLHLVLNFSSYFVGGIDTVLGLLGPIVELAAFMAMLVLGTVLFWLGTKEGQGPRGLAPVITLTAATLTIGPLASLGCAIACCCILRAVHLLGSAWPAMLL